MSRHIRDLLTHGRHLPGDGSQVVFGFSDKYEMCLKVVGGNNYIFLCHLQVKMTVILSQILVLFLHFYEILNIRYRNETYCFLT